MSRAAWAIRLISLVLLGPLPAAGEAWTSTRYGVGIESFPAGWHVEKEQGRVRLDKEFNKDGYGYAYNETMTFTIALDGGASLDETAAQLKGEGYLLEERSVVQFGQGSVPLWIFFHQASPQEVSWIALVLRSGLVDTFEVRGTPMDKDLKPDFKGLIAAFHFLPDGRQQACSDLEAQQANQARPLFKKLLGADSTDGNAWFGLGLADLARGEPGDAIDELQRADAILGTAEVRHALGQAYLQRGDPLRAVVVWYEYLDQYPDREEEMEPFINDALAAARLADNEIDEQHRKGWEDFAFIADRVSADLQVSLQDARSQEFNLDCRDRCAHNGELCRILYRGMLEHLKKEGGSAVEVHYLVAAHAVMRALDEAVDGFNDQNTFYLEESESRLTEGMEELMISSPHTEIEE
jgi:tetratricopeptide (TPR) repeat protein